MKKSWLIIGIALLLVAGIFYANQSNTSQARDARPEEGFLAPDFILKNEQGEAVQLSSYLGKPVFLNFWASWCPPCKAEMPAIQKAYESYGDQVVFYAVNVTAGDIKEEALNFMKSNHYEMPILFDYDGKAANLYRTKTIPTSFFIDKNGVIKVKHIGPMNGDQIESYLKKVMD